MQDLECNIIPYLGLHLSIFNLNIWGSVDTNICKQRNVLTVIVTCTDQCHEYISIFDLTLWGIYLMLCVKHNMLHPINACMYFR